MIRNLSYTSILALLILLFSNTSMANPAWYSGKVSRVALMKSDGSFVITFNNSDLDDCEDKYIYFDSATIGEGRMKHAFSMALTSLSTGVQMGAVIDKATNGPGGRCYAIGMVADLKK